MNLSTFGLSDDAHEDFSQTKHDDLIQYDAFLKTGGVLTGGLRHHDFMHFINYSNEYFFFFLAFCG